MAKKCLGTVELDQGPSLIITTLDFQPFWESGCLSSSQNGLKLSLGYHRHNFYAHGRGHPGHQHSLTGNIFRGLPLYAMLQHKGHLKVGYIDDSYLKEENMEDFQFKPRAMILVGLYFKPG